MAIPTIIHYCWFGGKPLPDDVKSYIEKWREICPSFTIKQWDETNFDITSIPYVLEAYNAKKWAFVSDYVRLWAVYTEGGLYLDTDVELVKTPEQYMQDYSCFLCEEIPGRINTGVGFAAEAHHPIVKTMLDEYQGIHFRQNQYFDLTPCPIRNTRALIKLGYSGKAGHIDEYNCQIFSSEFMSPINPETDEQNITNNTFSIHHFSGSWKTKEEQKRYELKKNLQKKYGRLGTLLYQVSSVFHSLRLHGIPQTLLTISSKLR